MRFPKVPHWLLWLAGLLVALIVVSEVVAQVRFGRASNRASAIQARVYSELTTNLPPGSTYEQIDSVLTKEKIGHSYAADEHRFYGLIPDVQKGFLISEDLQVFIDVDDQRRLVGIEITAVYTGP